MQGIWAVVGLRAPGSESRITLSCPCNKKQNHQCVCCSEKIHWLVSFLSFGKKVRLCVLYLHFQREEEPGTAANPGTRYRGLCSRKLVYPHTHCLFIITQLSVCYCLGNCGHQQTQQNNNAQGTILCTGPWEGPVEFLWSVSFWLFPIDAGPAIKCLECLVGTKWVGHRAIMLLSSMRSAVLWTDCQVTRGITNGLRIQIHGIFYSKRSFHIPFLKRFSWQSWRSVRQILLATFCKWDLERPREVKWFTQGLSASAG